MSERGNEVRVGVTITIAGIVLVLGVLWLGGVQFGNETYQFSIVFPEVAGLVVGDKVTVAGITSGEILSLELTNGKVLADIRLDQRTRIPVDSRISVSTYGLIGAKVIAIKPGQSREYIEPGQTVTGYYDQGLGDVVAEMGHALTEIRAVLSKADEAISDEETRRHIGNTLENAAEDVLKDVGAQVADVGVVVDRGTTAVEPDASRLERDKLFEPSAHGVVQLESHTVIAPMRALT